MSFPPPSPHFSPVPVVLFVISVLAPATSRSRHIRTGAGRLSVAHADVASCAPTAFDDTADFVAAALAADAPTRMVARTNYGGGSAGR